MVDRAATTPLSSYDHLMLRSSRLGRMGKALLHFVRAKPLVALGGFFVALMRF
jgi:hypothetical protein